MTRACACEPRRSRIAGFVSSEEMAAAKAGIVRWNRQAGVRVLDEVEASAAGAGGDRGPSEGRGFGIDQPEALSGGRPRVHIGGARKDEESRIAVPVQKRRFVDLSSQLDGVLGTRPPHRLAEPRVSSPPPMTIHRASGCADRTIGSASAIAKWPL